MNESIRRLTKHGFAIYGKSTVPVRRYNIGKRVITIRPYFNNKGAIKSFLIEDTKRRRKIKLVSSENLADNMSQLPVLCLTDIINLIADIFGLSGVSIEPRWIINSKCVLCEQTTPSFVATKLGAACMSCLKVKQ